MADDEIVVTGKYWTRYHKPAEIRTSVPACRVGKRGDRRRRSDVDGEKKPCQHSGCYGGPYGEEE